MADGRPASWAEKRQMLQAAMGLFKRDTWQQQYPRPWALYAGGWLVHLPTGVLFQFRFRGSDLEIRCRYLIKEDQIGVLGIRNGAVQTPYGLFFEESHLMEFAHLTQSRFYADFPHPILSAAVETMGIIWVNLEEVLGNIRFDRDRSNDLTLLPYLDDRQARLVDPKWMRDIRRQILACAAEFRRRTPPPPYKLQPLFFYPAKHEPDA